MFQIGDRVKIKNSTKEYILKEFKNNNKSCIIKDGIEEIVVFVNCLELVEEKIYFTGEEIKLDNKLGAIAEIYYGYNKQKKKCICVDIITSNTITAFFNNLEEVNLFLKSLGFKEVLQEDKFNLIEFLKENLEPKEFEYGARNRYISYEHDLEEFEYQYDYYNEDIGTVYIKELKDYPKIISELTINEVTPQQLKEAYKELGWL